VLLIAQLHSTSEQRFPILVDNPALPRKIDEEVVGGRARPPLPHPKLWVGNDLVRTVWQELESPALLKSYCFKLLIKDIAIVSSMVSIFGSLKKNRKG
jgi:hypothetical protein